MIDKLSNKTKIISVGILSLLLCSLIMATFTDIYIMNNNFNTGNIKIDVSIYKTDDENKKISLNEIEYVDLEKNSSYISSIKNVSASSYIRIKLEVLSEDNSLKKYMSPNTIKISNPDLWLFKDNYFYYNDILEPNESTSFTKEISFSNEDFDNINSDILKLKMTVEAIQSKNIQKHELDTVWNSKDTFKTETVIANNLKDGD